MNFVKLTGNVGNQILIKDLGHKRMISFSVAVNEYQKGRAKSTSWYKIVTFGKAADECELLLGKGRFVAIEGKLVNRKYTNANHEIIYGTEILAFRVKALMTSSGSFHD